MYDWIKMDTNDVNTMQALLSNPELDFTADINPDTGAFKPVNEKGTIKRTASDHGLTFNVFDSGRTEIKGSLHKFFNSITRGVEHNYNDFTIDNVTETIHLINKMYGVIPENTIVHNLETGVNIQPSISISVNQILDFIKSYKHLKFNKMKLHTKGKGKEVYFQQYGIKVYNKGVQYSCDEDILRYEIKYIKMKAIGRDLKLSDLTDANVWTDIAERLRQSLENILFTDLFDDADLTIPEKKLFIFCNNTDDWEQADKTKRSKAKPRFEKLIQDKGKYKLCNLLTDLVSRKIDVISRKTSNLLTDCLKEEKQPFNCLSSRLDSCIPSLEQLQYKYPNYFDSDAVRCQVTGLPVFDSKTHLSPYSLRLLKSQYEEVYFLVRTEFMTKHVDYTSKEKNEFSYIAKQIRNRISNSKKQHLKAIRKSVKNQQQLFN